MFKWLKDRIQTIIEAREISRLRISPRGERFIHYCQDMLAGENYRNESFEEAIREMMEKFGLEREEAIKELMAVLQQLKPGG